MDTQEQLGVNYSFSRIIEVNKASIFYDKLSVLKDIDLIVNKKDLIAIVGASGAGKTTLLNLLGGIVAPSQGTINIFGSDFHQNHKSQKEIQRKIGVVYQDLDLVDSLTVVHNVNVGRLGEWSFLKALWSLMRPVDVDRVHNVLFKLRISEKIFNKTATLSRGQKQRVAIARVLIQNPEILILDEPISSLDVRSARETLEIVCGFKQTLDKTVIVSLHSIDLALEYFDRIVGIKKGSLIFDLPKNEVTTEQIKELLS